MGAFIRERNFHHEYFLIFSLSIIIEMGVCQVTKRIKSCLLPFINLYTCISSRGSNLEPCKARHRFIYGEY